MNILRTNTAFPARPACPGTKYCRAPPLAGGELVSTKKRNNHSSSQLSNIMFTTGREGSSGVPQERDSYARRSRNNVSCTNGTEGRSILPPCNVVGRVLGRYSQESAVGLHWCFPRQTSSSSMSRTTGVCVCCDPLAYICTTTHYF